jgi:hypothetical protein
MTFKHLFFSLLVIVALTSCEDPVHIEYGLDGTIHNNDNNDNNDNDDNNDNNDNDDNNDDNDDNDDSSTLFRATIDGDLYEPANSSATIVNGITNVTGIDTNGETITITIVSDQVGTYSLDFDGSSTISTGLAYKENSDATESYLSGNTIDNSTGSIEITSIDTTNNLISGTFYATARNGSGASVTITSGEFTNIPFETELPNNNENEFFAKVNGDEFVEDSIEATKATLAGNTNITLTATKNSFETIGITIPFSNSDAGTYNFSSIPSQNVYVAQYNVSQTEFYVASSGSITITSHDTATKKITGTFYFTAQPQVGSTPTFEITEGSFNVTYTE